MRTLTRQYSAVARSKPPLWLEDLRNLFAEQARSIGEAIQRGIAPALMRTKIDYLAPVRFPDTVTGRMW
jgi:acyl-CoA thioesterase FadM